MEAKEEGAQIEEDDYCGGWVDFNSMDAISYGGDC